MADEGIEVEAPTLAIPLELYRKLLAYVEACDNEISGFFEVDYDEKDNQFNISKVYDLLKQEVGGAEVEIDEEEIAKFNSKLISDGAKQLPRGWWHSHNTMGAFLSPTDTATIDKLKNNSYIVAIVLNKAREIHASLQLFNPLKLSIKMKVVTNYHDNSLMAKAKKEVKEKVMETQTTGTGYAVHHNDEENGVHPSWGQPFSRKQRKKEKRLAKQYGFDATRGVSLRSFPEDIEEAADLVLSLNLERRYDHQLDCIVYMDKEANVIYMDNNDTFTYDEFTDINKGTIQARDLT